VPIGSAPDRSLNDESVTKTCGPDFLCIGAPKCGTTWLYKHLSDHPQIWIPPVKELHYFDGRFPLPTAGEKVTVRKGVLGLFPQHNRRRIFRVIGRSVLHVSLAELRWAIRFFQGNGTDEWYLSLFAPAGDRVSGELTTDYCALSTEGVGHIRALLPEVKIVFLMRNPIERAWSHAKMLLPELSGKPLARISTQEFLTYLSAPGPRVRGNYPRTLDIWESAFPSAQVCIGFFEDLSARPQSFLQRIVEFLGLPPDGLRVGANLTAKVNPGAAAAAPRTMPGEIATALARHYLPDLQQLSDRFGSHATTWLRECEHILEHEEHRSEYADTSTSPVTHALSVQRRDTR